MFQVGSLAPDIGILACWTWPWENAAEHRPPAPQGGQPWVHRWRMVTCAGESAVSSARRHQSLLALLCKAWGPTSGGGSKLNLFASLSSCSAKIFPSCTSSSLYFGLNAMPLLSAASVSILQWSSFLSASLFTISLHLFSSWTFCATAHPVPSWFILSLLYRLQAVLVSSPGSCPASVFPYQHFLHPLPQANYGHLFAFAQGTGTFFFEDLIPQLCQVPNTICII